MTNGKIQSKDDGMTSVEVQILGQRFVLKSDADQRHVERLVTYVKRKVDEIGAKGPVSSSKLAVLAALNIADDYFKVLEESREFRKQVASQSRSLLADLDDEAPASG